MTATREHILRQHMGVLETATGRPAGEQQIRAALDLSSGARVIVADPGDSLLIASFAAIASDEPHVHVVTESAEDADLLSATFTTSGFRHITCAPAEAFVFDYLKGNNAEREFAIVANAGRILLFDGHTPVILMKPAASVEAVSSVTSEAEHLQNGRDYVVQGGEIVIRDPESGTLYPGRRFIGGLHGALQVREGLSVDAEGEVVAQITMGDYFRQYKRLAGVAQSHDDRYQTEYGLVMA